MAAQPSGRRDQADTLAPGIKRHRLVVEILIALGHVAGVVFARLVAEQWMMGSPAAVSFPQVLIMLVFLAVGAAIGLPRYIHAAATPAAWGRR